MVNLSKLNPQPKNICSIDASTNSLAFAIFDSKELTAIGKINFKGANTYEKVTDASAKTAAFFKAYGIPDSVVIEHTVFINSPKTAADLALVQGAILGAMGVAGVDNIKSINPIAWQTFIGNGRLNKEEKKFIRDDTPGKSESWYKSKERELRKLRTMHFVEIQYDKILLDNDVADAIGIGHYAINNWEKLS
jgi:Holliday junction resolvasome RuvABC endonuclease subunit